MRYARATRRADRLWRSQNGAARIIVRNTVIVVAAVSPKHLSDRDVRLKLGVSIADAARLAGVAENTLTMWEIAPDRSSRRTRERCEKLYTGYRIALQHGSDGRT